MITKLYGAPGTGKTTKLLDILHAELEDGVPIERIAFVTHTVSAKEEAQTRARAILPHIKPEAFKYFRTIHGICFHVIGLGKQQVMQMPDFMKFADECGIPFSRDFTSELDDDGLPVGYNGSNGNEILAVRQYASAWMNSYLEFEDRWPTWADADSIKEILDKYAEFKGRAAKFDFVDMLEMYLANPYPLDVDVVIVDEAQDLSRLQWSVVENIYARAKRIYLAGDDDQAIYGFIGADPLGFLHKEVDDKIVLPKTYRLRRNIWEYAKRLISHNADRQRKDIDVRDIGGEIDYWNAATMYLDYECEGTTMVVARHHKQLTDIAQELTDRGISFTHRGMSLSGTIKARSVYDYFHLKRGGEISIKAAVRILEQCFGKGNESLQRAREEAREDVTRYVRAKYLEALGISFSRNWIDVLARNDYDVRRNEKLDIIIQEKGFSSLVNRPSIDLTTYHACKGRQADHVILFTDCYRSAYDAADKEPDDERRLAYVGVTRAKEKLTIVAPETDMYMRSLI